MYLKKLYLQHFRSYEEKLFLFDETTSFIVGKNTSGKTNLIEAIYFLATGKSFRAEKDLQAIAFGSEIGRVKGIIADPEANHLAGDGIGITIEVVLTTGMVSNTSTQQKRFLVNDVPKRRVDFEGHLVCVLFSPSDLELIIGSPGVRRRFLDDVLEQIDREYRLATTTYEKALRQRNALLDLAKETGRRNEEQFAYWDDLLIKNGQLITEKRETFIRFLNEQNHDIFPCTVFYDKSTVSKERLLQYKEAEIGAGVTLVGPQRDDFSITMVQEKNVKHFASRGQQRLIVLQLKMLQTTFMEQVLGFRPVLLLDDIFSELDTGHIQLVLDMLGKQQTILTTTHEEFLGTKFKGSTVITL